MLTFLDRVCCWSSVPVYNFLLERPFEQQLRVQILCYGCTVNNIHILSSIIKISIICFISISGSVKYIWPYFLLPYSIILSQNERGKCSAEAQGCTARKPCILPRKLYMLLPYGSDHIFIDRFFTRITGSDLTSWAHAIKCYWYLAHF